MINHDLWVQKKRAREGALYTRTRTRDDGGSAVVVRGSVGAIAAAEAVMATARAAAAAVAVQPTSAANSSSSSSASTGDYGFKGSFAAVARHEATCAQANAAAAGSGGAKQQQEERGLSGSHSYRVRLLSLCIHVLLFFQFPSKLARGASCLGFASTAALAWRYRSCAGVEGLN